MALVLPRAHFFGWLCFGDEDHPADAWRPNDVNPVFQPGKSFNWMVHSLLRFSQQISGHVRALTKTTEAVDYHTFKFSHSPEV